MRTARRFINTLRPGETLDQVFLVRDKDLRTTKSGDLYITCSLVDRSGQLPARMWQANQAVYNAIQTDGFIQVKGRTEDYRGSLQFVIDACRPCPSDRVDLNDFMAVSELDVEGMWAELLEILRDVKDEWLRRLIKKFVEDRDLVALFKKTPAAMNMHHNFIGGLLEHTLNVAKAARAMLPLYQKVNADLVLTGVFLHDIGKTAELTSGTSFQYTEQGQLVGHVTLASIWVAQKAQEAAQDCGEAFPSRTLNLLQHIILSHHGALEFGSPKLPAIPEAFMIHYLDNLDAKMFMTTRQIENDPDESSDFTAFQRDLQVRLYKKSGAL